MFHGFADIFFSLWLNEVPTQFSTIIFNQRRTSDSQDISFSDTDDFYTMQRRAASKAITIIEKELRLNLTQGSAFPRHVSRRFPFHVMTPSLDDNLIFYTNIIPLDFPNTPFNISVDKERATPQNYPSGPTFTYFMNNPPTNAVDKINETCWKHKSAIRIGQYFAIDFLRIHTNIRFILIIRHDRHFHEKLRISISLDGIHWIIYPSLNGFSHITDSWVKMNEFQIYRVDSSDFIKGFSSFRYIKFQAMMNSHHILQVCEIQLLQI